MATLLYRLGTFAARRRWTVIVSWVVLLALAGAGYGLFAGTMSSSVTIPGTATEKVTNQLSQGFSTGGGGSGTLVITTKDDHAFTAAQKAGVRTLLDKIDDLHGVTGTTDPFTAQQQLESQRTKVADGVTQLDAAATKLADGRTQLAGAQKQLDTQRAQLAAAGAPADAVVALNAAQTRLDAQQAALNAGEKTLTENRTTLDLSTRLLDLSRNVRIVSADGSAAMATVSFHAATTAIPQSVKTSVIDAVGHAGITGVTITVSSEIAQSIPSVMGAGELIGVLIAAVVLVLMLGTVIGAFIPLVSALFGVGVGLLASMSFSGIVQFVSVTPVLGVMLGLAVGIDYSLFILNRHRTQLRQGVAVRESIGLANGTSGSAVVFAGSTVIVALLALNITGIPFLGLMGTVGAAAVAAAILIAVTFTPAVLSLVGMRILRRKERGAIGHPRTRRVPMRPMRTWRAVVTLVVGVGVLAAIAIPATQMRLGLPDGSSEATTSPQYQSFMAVKDKFGAGQNGPLIVLADLPAKTTGTALLRQEVTVGEKIADQGHVHAVVPIGASHDSTKIAFEVVPTTGPNRVQTENLVHALRGLSPLTTDAGTVRLGVAGNASANIDVSQKLADALPLYLVVVVGLSLLILIVVFRSFLVPLTATAGFVLSLLATFGGLTAIYQFGWLGGVFGVHDPGPILSFLPIIQVGVLFGLAMDYQLFLVSGMREAYAHGVPARLAVQRGLHAGRSVVTAAAIIMTSVFAGFVFSDSSMIRPIGFGLAFGVLVDAFVVRMLLIPAIMHLMGKAAWWFPRWLDRILPDADVEGAKLHQPQATTVDGPPVEGSDTAPVLTH